MVKDVNVKINEPSSWRSGTFLDSLISNTQNSLYSFFKTHK